MASRFRIVDEPETENTKPNQNGLTPTAQHVLDRARRAGWSLSPEEAEAAARRGYLELTPWRSPAPPHRLYRRWGCIWCAYDDLDEDRIATLHRSSCAGYRELRETGQLPADQLGSSQHGDRSTIANPNGIHIARR